MRWNIIVESVGEDGKQSTITLNTIERLVGSTTAEASESIFKNRSRLRTGARHRSKATAARAL